MEGQRGRIDATDQIKQLLRLPLEDTGAGAAPKPAPSENKACIPPLVVPHHKQMSSSNRELRGGSPSTKQHTHHHNSHHHHQWDPHRYHDGRHNSPGRGGGGRGYYDPTRTHYDSGRPQYDTLRSHFDPARTQPNRYQNQFGRQRTDSYGSPGRGGASVRGYEMGRDHKDLRLNNYQQQQQQQQHRPATHQNSNNNSHTSNSSSSSSSSVQGSVDIEPPDFLPSPEVLAELEQHFIYPLKKKSLKFPKAKYFCRLCDYHCDSLVVCKRHVSETRHRKLKEAKDIETTLKNLPPPSEAQVTAIDKLINSLAEEWRVDKAMAKQRQEVVKQLSNLLMDRIKGCRLEMVGSSLSGFCLKTSDINIDVVMEDNLNPSTALLAVKELVTCHRLYRDVKDDLTSSYPTMSFTHIKTGLRIVVGAGGSASKLTNQLLADYASLDPRVHVLGVAFRRWAQLCQIDDQTRGTLPPHVFSLMVVHFLQQHRPHILPCLHSKPDSETYCRPEELKDKWQTMNTESVGKLWLELFRFYTVGFKMADNVINVRQLHPMSKGEKTWSKKIAVEDPFVQKRNLTRTVSGNPVFEYIGDRLKTTYKYFAIPQLSYGPLFIHIIAKEARSGSRGKCDAAFNTKKGDVLLESIEKAGHSLSEGSSECEMERTEEVLEETTEPEDNTSASNSGLEKDLSTLTLEEMTEETGDSVTRNGVSSEEEGEGEGVVNIEEVASSIPSITTTQASSLMFQILSRHLSYKFDGQKFTSGQSPPLICGSCQKEGHCKADCHEDDLPPLKSLPVMNNYFLNQLTVIFERLTRDFEPSNEEIEERDRIVADLESYIRQFFQTVTLKLFGSSANGFGFQGSDLDICLTFDGNPSGANIDHIKIIESLAEKLKRYRQCGHVFAITTAKVPIVKFSIRRACLEGDLSLYNTLALQNTKLLSTYASIDYRVKCLGYAMKYFAKLCDIGDASRGSLSSYAYILMVLHFLQQCRPPVIPVLQELYDHSKPAPHLMIDGWNAWFYDDLPNLKSAWKDYGKNKESVGQLWVGMLRYYTETFNWKEHVVTIRQAASLTRLQKLWNSRCIAIEDPFDLSHNLGAGLSRKMNTFIMKAFIRGRELFGSAIMAPPPGYRNLVDYLFDCKQLTDGAPPNDRGCRFCGKIGHIQKDCPKKKVNLEKRDKKERQKDRREMRRSAETEMPEKSTTAEAGTGGGRERRETRPSQGPPALTPSCTLPEDVAPGPVSKAERSHHMATSGRSHPTATSDRNHHVSSERSHRVGTADRSHHAGTSERSHHTDISERNTSERGHHMSTSDRSQYVGSERSHHAGTSGHTKQDEEMVSRVSGSGGTAQSVCRTEESSCGGTQNDGGGSLLTSANDAPQNLPPPVSVATSASAPVKPVPGVGLSTESTAKLSTPKGDTGRDGNENVGLVEGLQEVSRNREPPVTSALCFGVSGSGHLRGTLPGHTWGHPETVLSGMAASGAVSAPPGFQNIGVHHLRPPPLLNQGEPSDMKLASQPHSSAAHLSRLAGSPSVVTSQLVASQVHHRQEPQQQQSHQKITLVEKQQHQQQQQHHLIQHQQQIQQQQIQQQIQQQQQQQPQVQQQQQQQQQRIARQCTYWPTTALPQPPQVSSKPQKEESDKPKTYQGSSSNHTQQTHQQQYPFSISPAALFHLASQAPSGQVSAVLVPGATESSSGATRPGLSGSTGPTDNPSNSGTQANPPPGFSAPLAVSYHTQSGDAIPVNKLLMSSQLYRSSVSQSDGQGGASSVSQPFMGVSQAPSGAVAGVYVQQGNLGGQYTNLALTPSAHTPHTFGDPSLAQQQMAFETRHFIPQQVAQGLHQGVAQGVHQGLHQGMAQGMHQSIPQGLHQNVTQGVASGVPQAGSGVPLPPPGLPVSLPQGLSQNVSQVNLGSALSQGLPGVPMGHHLQQHPFSQPAFPQQGYQVAVGGGSGYYPEYVLSDPGLQNPSSGTQQGPPPPTALPAEMISDVAAFQRAEVFDGTSLHTLPQFLPSSLPQHQSLMSQTPLSHPPHQHPSLAQPPHPSLSHTHPSIALPPHHTNGPPAGAPYTPASLIYIEGERDTGQVIQ